MGSSGIISKYLKIPWPSLAMCSKCSEWLHRSMILATGHGHFHHACATRPAAMASPQSGSARIGLPSCPACWALDILDTMAVACQCHGMGWAVGFSGHCTYKAIFCGDIPLHSPYMLLYMVGTSSLGSWNGQKDMVSQVSLRCHQGSGSRCSREVTPIGWSQGVEAGNVTPSQHNLKPVLPKSSKRSISAKVSALRNYLQLERIPTIPKLYILGSVPQRSLWKCSSFG